MLGWHASSAGRLVRSLLTLARSPAAVRFGVDRLVRFRSADFSRKPRWQVERENEDGYRYYELDEERRNEFINSIDFSDPYHAAQAWRVVLAAMMLDYRYMYL